jgi:hypothetical protein
MPRYFFDLADGSREIDDVGTELPNLNEARPRQLFLAAGLSQTTLRCQRMDPSA